MTDIETEVAQIREARAAQALRVTGGFTTDELRAMPDQVLGQIVARYEALMEGLGLDPSYECFDEYPPARLKAEGYGLRMLIERELP